MQSIKNFFREFRTFAMRGNVVDLAVGIIIGTSFNSVVNSVVNDIVMPPFGLILGKVNFASRFVVLDGGKYPTVAAAKAAGAPTINYGNFINIIISFLIVAFVVFLLIRSINKLKREPKKEDMPASEKICPFCQTVINIKAIRCPNCTSELK